VEDVMKNKLIAVLDWMDAYHGEIILAVVVATICWYFIVTGRP
jgi:hypothetical protein